MTLNEKINKASDVLRLAAKMSATYYQKPLIVTYSGGKDSDVMLHIAEGCLKADEFEVLNSHTTADAPQTVWHIRKVFKDLNSRGIKATEHYPKDADGKQITMWNLIPRKKMPPTRVVRYCCKVLKETQTPNRICAVGVRRDESNSRKNRDVFGLRADRKADAKFWSLEHSKEVFTDAERERERYQLSPNEHDPFDCQMITAMKDKQDLIVNPIYEFTEADIWNYINENHIVVNPLYYPPYNFNRVGCIGCPMATYTQRMKEFSEFPKYKTMYVNAFQRMLEMRAKDGNPIGEWKDGEDVFNWYVEEYKHNVKGQMSIADIAKNGK